MQKRENEIHSNEDTYKKHTPENLILAIVLPINLESVFCLLWIES